MEKEKLQKLESIYVRLNFAYNQRNENDMRILFKEFDLSYPEFKNNKWENINKIFKEHSLYPLAPCPIDLVYGAELNYNIEGCLRTIWAILKSNKYQTFSSHCIEVLYFPQKAFTPTDVLYTNPIQSNNSEKPNTLKVSDLLSVAKYSLQVLEII